VKNSINRIQSSDQNITYHLKKKTISLLIVGMVFLALFCTSQQGSWKWLHSLTEEEAAALVAYIPNQIEQGPFKPDIESLRSYDCPEWFRDAKFGIWICYIPQSVPARSGWYGRWMYVSKEDDRRGLLEYHKEHYGHPSEFGFKDFIPELTAEKFDPDYLVGLFKEAGAKYFIALAVHHENFDLWDSEYHRWNAVNMGPEKDIIGMFKDATLKHGLRWGVTTHLARSYSWLQVAHGKDDQGEFDGNNPEYWDFYHKPFDQNDVHYPYDPPDSWKLTFFLRVKDLIDKYQPDLMYFDGSVPFLPDGEPGLAILAHLYNSSIKWHNGTNEAVMNIKDHQVGLYDDDIATLDLERRQLLDIRKKPWQNDTSIGPWFYTNGAKYKSVPAIIHMLIDIVSKNGNLLLNVPMRADGTIDNEAKDLMVGIGKWMKINGDALYGTRPWKVAGESKMSYAEVEELPEFFLKKDAAARTKDTDFQLHADEIRFAQKGDVLYAICVGWPEKEWVIGSFASTNGLLDQEIKNVSPKGNNNNPGTIEKSFASIIRARDAVREVIKQGITEDIVGFEEFDVSMDHFGVTAEYPAKFKKLDEWYFEHEHEAGADSH